MPKLQAIYKKGGFGTGIFLRILRNTCNYKTTAKASSKLMKNLARHIHCKRKLLLKESFIDRNGYFENLDPDPGPGPRTLDPDPGPWTRTLENLDPEKPEP